MGKENMIKIEELRQYVKEIEAGNKSQADIFDEISERIKIRNYVGFEVKYSQIKEIVECATEKNEDEILYIDYMLADIMTVVHMARLYTNIDISYIYENDSEIASRFIEVYDIIEQIGMFEDYNTKRFVNPDMIKFITETKRALDARQDMFKSGIYQIANFISRIPSEESLKEVMESYNNVDPEILGKISDITKQNGVIEEMTKNTIKIAEKAE